MKKKSALFLCLLILILGTVVRLSNGTKKVYYHMDEAYSYGLMNDQVLNITDRPDFWNRVHDSGYYRSYLSIDESERSDWSPVYANQQRDVHPPLYYLLLRTAASMAGGGFTKWSGLLLNGMLSVVGGILLYQLGRDLTGKREYGCLACLFGSLTVLSQEMSLYIRMYELANVAVLFLFWTHLHWIRKQTRAPLLLCAVAYLLAGLTHYYCLLFAVGLWLLISGWLMVKRNFKGLLAYQICAVGAAVLFLLLFPSALSHVFGGYRGFHGGALASASPAQMVQMLCILDEEALHLGIPLLFLLCFAMGTKTMRKPLIFLLAPLVLYLTAVLLQAPYAEDRYLMPASGATALVAVLALTGTLQRVKQGKWGFCLAGGILALLLALPAMEGRELSYAYRQYAWIVGQAEEHHPDMVYLFDPQDNRFLDDIYLFTQSNKSYIMDCDKTQRAELEKVCGSMGDRVWVFCNREMGRSMVEQMAGWEIQGVQRMNACDIFLCQRKG